MISKGVKVLIAVVVIGLLLTAGVAFAKPGHGHGHGRGHFVAISHGKDSNNHAPGTVDKKGRIRIKLITGTVSIESSTTVAPHVHLRLVNASGKTCRAAQSKKNGRYWFKNLKLTTGDYKVKAWFKKAKAYYSGETTLTVEAGKSAYDNVNIILKK